MLWVYIQQMSWVNGTHWEQLYNLFLSVTYRHSHCYKCELICYKKSLFLMPAFPLLALCVEIWLLTKLNLLERPKFYSALVFSLGSLSGVFRAEWPLVSSASFATASYPRQSPSTSVRALAWLTKPHGKCVFFQLIWTRCDISIFQGAFSVAFHSGAVWDVSWSINGAEHLCTSRSFGFTMSVPFCFYRK